MKSLFDENDKYTATAEVIDRQAITALRPIFDFWVKEGYSKRDICHVMHMSALDMMLMSVAFGEDTGSNSSVQERASETLGVQGVSPDHSEPLQLSEGRPFESDLDHEEEEVYGQSKMDLEYWLPRIGENVVWYSEGVPRRLIAAYQFFDEIRIKVEGLEEQMICPVFWSFDTDEERFLSPEAQKKRFGQVTCPF